MPAAIPRPIREELARRCQTGQTLAAVAEALGLSYRSVRRLWRRYRLQGESGLDNAYAHCGLQGPRFPKEVYEAALALRREHPRFGAVILRLRLEDQLPGQALPSQRTLNRWLKAAGFQSLRGRRPRVSLERAKTPHEVWQIDAKERLRLGDGQGVCQLSVVDEGSGASLGVVPFPPLALEPGGSERRPERA